MSKDWDNLSRQLGREAAGLKKPKRRKKKQVRTAPFSAIPAFKRLKERLDKESPGIRPSCTYHTKRRITVA